MGPRPWKNEIQRMNGWVGSVRPLPLQGLGLAANVGEDTLETLPRLGLRTCDALRHPPPV